MLGIEPADSGAVQPVPCFFKIIDLDDGFLQSCVRLLESRQFAQRVPRFRAALANDGGKLNRFGADGSNVIHEHLANDVLDKVRNVVDLLQQENDIFALDRSDKLLGELLHEIVLFNIGFVLDFMHFLKLLGQLFRLVMFQNGFQVLRRFAGALHAGDKPFEVIVDVLLFHFFSPPILRMLVSAAF